MDVEINMDNIEDKTSLDRKKKYILTAAICLAGLALGTGVALNGPCLIDLAAIANSTVGKLSWIFTGSAAGGILGSILVPLVAKKFTLWVPMGIALILAGFVNLILPWLQYADLMITATFGFGIGKSFIDTTSVFMIMDIWQKENGPWLQAHACVHAIGFVLAPLIAKPFLSTPQMSNTVLLDETPEEDESSTVSHLDYYTAPENNGPTFSGAFEVNPNITSSTPSITSESVLYKAYLIVAVLFFISAITIIALGLVHHFIWHIKSVPRKNKTSSKTELGSLTPALYKNLHIGSLCAVIFSYSLVEHATFMFLFTFAVKVTHWTKDSAVLLVFLYMLFFTLTRAVCALLARCVQPRSILLVFSLLTLTCSFILMLWHKVHNAILWTCGIGIGIGISPLFSSAITFFNMYNAFTPLVGALVQIATMASGLVVPSLLGFFYIFVGPVIFVYIIFIGSVIELLCVFAMGIFGRVLERQEINQASSVHLT